MFTSTLVALLNEDLDADQGLVGSPARSSTHTATTTYPIVRPRAEQKLRELYVMRPLTLESSITSFECVRDAGPFDPFCAATASLLALQSVKNTH
jgi:hypothetical protein